MGLGGPGELPDDASPGVELADSGTLRLFYVRPDRYPIGSRQSSGWFLECARSKLRSPPFALVLLGPLPPPRSHGTNSRIGGGKRRLHSLRAVCAAAWFEACLKGCSCSCGGAAVVSFRFDPCAAEALSPVRSLRIGSRELCAIPPPPFGWRRPACWLVLATGRGTVKWRRRIVFPALTSEGCLLFPPHSSPKVWAVGFESGVMAPAALVSSLFFSSLP